MAEDGIRDSVASRGLGDVYKRQGLIREMDGAIKSVAQISELARDDIYKQRFLVGETSSIEWDFRKDYTQAILNVMGKYQLIPFESPFIGEMTSFSSETEIEEIAEMQPVEQSQPQPVEEQERQQPVEQLQPQPFEEIQPVERSQSQPVEQLQPQPVEEQERQQKSTVKKKEKKRKFEV